MDRIFYKKILVGIRIRKLAKGSVPITDEKEPLQLVGLRHLKGLHLKPHFHAPKKRVTHRLQEAFVVREGRVKIDLYGSLDKEGRRVSRKKFKSIIIKKGEVFLLFNGGYGIHILEDAELFEFKNGPFLEDKVLI